MLYQRECLYDVEWQLLRVSLLGTWTSVDNVLRNTDRLITYKNSGQDRWERLERCTNYMAAILLGYGSKPEFREQAEIIRQCHYWMQGHRRLEYPLGDDWNWLKVEADLYKIDRLQAKAIWDDLQKRVYTSVKRTGGLQHRPELSKFLELLKERLQ